MCIDPMCSQQHRGVSTVKKFMIGLTFAVVAMAATTNHALATVVGGRPAHCPRAYCGCATAMKVGLSGSFWNLAANYKVLPRASCAPGMVAARHGHVFVIQACHGNGTVTAWDPNSGGGKTRVHTVSLAGYTIHNPRGGNAYASYGRGKKNNTAHAATPQQAIQVAWWEGWPHRVLDQQQSVTPRRTYRDRSYRGGRSYRVARAHYAPRRHMRRYASR